MSVFDESKYEYHVDCEIYRAYSYDVVCAPERNERRSSRKTVDSCYTSARQGERQLILLPSAISNTLIKIVMNEQKQQGRQEVEDALRSKIALGSALTFRDVVENTHYIKYEPTGMQQRVIRIQQVQQDPLKPPSFRSKKVSTTMSLCGLFLISVSGASRRNAFSRPGLAQSTASNFG